MAEYIERDAAMDAIQKAFSDQECDCEVMPDVFGALQEIPAADVAPVVHGRWENFRGKPRCSQCKAVWPEDYFEHNCCPRCGAKMDGGKE